MTLTCWYDYYYMDGHIKYFVSFIIILMIYVGSRYFILIFWKKTTCRAGIHCSVTSHKWWSLSFCYYLYLFNGPNCQIGWESERESAVIVFSLLFFRHRRRRLIHFSNIRESSNGSCILLLFRLQNLVGNLFARLTVRFIVYSIGLTYIYIFLAITIRAEKLMFFIRIIEYYLYEVDMDIVWCRKKREMGSMRIVTDDSIIIHSTNVLRYLRQNTQQSTHIHYTKIHNS